MVYERPQYNEKDYDSEMFFGELTNLYYAINRPSRKKVLIDVNRLLYKFIWQKRFSNRKAFENVKRVIVEENLEDGGLKLVNVVHLQKAFHLQWVRKLAKSGEEK